MNLPVVFRVAAAYMSLVGLGLICAPRAIGVGAMPASPSSELIAFLRLWGCPLLGIAVLDWSARDAEPSKTRDAVVAGNVVGFATIAAVDVWGVIAGGRGAHLAFAVVHALFAAAFVWAGRKATAKFTLDRRGEPRFAPTPSEDDSCRLRQ